MSGHPPMVKICGLQRAQDAALADELGADYLGVILSAGFSRSVSGPVAAQILLGTSARRVAVVVDESAEDALALAESIEADVLQLHGTESPEMLADLAARWGGLIWKAVRAGALADLQDVVSTHKDLVDGFLVEGWKDGVGRTPRLQQTRRFRTSSTDCSRSSLVGRRPSTMPPDSVMPSGILLFISSAKT